MVRSCRPRQARGTANAADKPALFLRHYPQEIRAAAPPTTARERALGKLAALPLFTMLTGVPYGSAAALAQRHTGSISVTALFIDAFAVGMVFNLVDWLALDILLLGLKKPKWAAIPGTEQVAFRFNHRQHFRGFLVGTAVAAGIALLVTFALGR